VNKTHSLLTYFSPYLLSTVYCLLLLVSLTACAASETNQEVLTPLDPADWPTAVPDQTRSTPTPFPTVDTALIEAAKATAEAQKGAEIGPPVRLAAVEEEPTLVPTAQPTPVPEGPEAQPAGNTEADGLVSEQTAAIGEPTSDDPAELGDTVVSGPVVSGTVASFGLNVRSGPGLNFEVLFALAQGEPLTVLATDEASPWIKVRAANGLPGSEGWVNSKYVNLEGNLGRVPPEQVDQPDPAATSGVTSEPPQPPSSGERLLIQRESGGDILIINHDGTGLRRVTTGIDPVLSPDGNKIAFTRWGGGEVGELWVANTDGSGEALIFGGMRKAKSPSWSPDSRRIALNFQEGGTIEVTRQCRDLDRGEPDINFWTAFDVELEYEEIEGQQVPARLCWKVPPDPHWKLRVIDLGAQTYQDLPAGQYAFAPTWDPVNEQRIVSVNRLGLVWTDVSQGQAYPLTDDSSDRAPVFSPDGRYIAVTYWQHDHWEVHRLNADGSGRVRLTKTPLYAFADNPDSARQWNNASPVFSPDSTEIAFLTDRTGRWEIWAMNIDGSNQRPLFPQAINDQLAIRYEGNDARMLGWGQ